jgi:Ca-activated chloride channel homolog
MPEAFHFLRPLWLLALLPLSLLAWRAYMPGRGDNPWRRVVDASLLPLLMVSQRASSGGRLATWLLALGWLVAVLALADPTWERKPQPVFQTTTSRVIVLDLSSSMETADLKPTRLGRARYRIEDILAFDAEGQTGLVVYAGDAFTVSPLTRDANTIRALLNALDPSIMPIQGQRADLGLLKAGELLRQAGASSGQIVLITDGVEAKDVGASERAIAQLRREGYQVAVVGVIADASAPSPGQAARDTETKAADMPDAAALRSLAQSGGGAYQPVTASAEALHGLLDDRPSTLAADSTQTDATTQAWKEQGPLLVVLLLPLAALAFRRNWLLGIVVLIGFASPPPSAEASTWDDLWQRQDQQAAKALKAGDYAKASALATDPLSRGTAEYKRGNYQAANDELAKATGADADYNRGNALAKLGRYQDAVAAYDKALKQDPSSDDARANKAAVEAMLKKQPPQQQASNKGGDASPNSESKQGDADKKSSPGGGKGSPPKDGAANNDASNSQQGQGNADQSESTSRQSDKSHDAAGKSDAASNNDHQAPSKSAPESAKDSGNAFADAAKKLAEQKAGAGKDDAAAASTASARSGAMKPATPDATKAAEAAAEARPLDSEEQIAAEQWLRRIPDDPGGLLRRKFLYQYRQRTQRGDADGN